MKTRRHLGFFLAFALAGGCLVARAADAPPADTGALKEKIQQLVRQLGAGSFRERQEAQDKLARLPRRASKLLSDFRNSDDPEIRARVDDAIRALTNAVPIDAVCDEDWASDPASPEIESVPLRLKDGRSMTLSLEYGEMAAGAPDQGAVFLSRTNRLTFMMDQTRRLGLAISATEPFRAFTFLAYPRMLNEAGEWNSFCMYPSEWGEGRRYCHLDYMRSEVDTPGALSFSTYVNGYKVRTVAIELVLPGAQPAAAGSESSARPAGETSRRMPPEALVAYVDRHIPDERTAIVSSQREGELTIEGPGEGMVASLSDISFLKGLDVDGLTLRGLPIADLSPLAGLPLRSLSLKDLEATDLSPLARLPVTNLVLGLAASDLASLKDMPLKTLELSHQGLRDLSPLQGMGLTKLVIDMDYIQITNLSIVSTMPLSDLELTGHAKDCDYAWLPALTNLSRLSLVAGHIDLSILQRTSVTDLELTGGAATNVAALKGMKLRRFGVHSQRLTDISALEGMPLTAVDLAGTGVGDLTPLRGVPLEALNISGAPVRDISVLRGMPLKRLDMTGTSIEDLTPLEGMAFERLCLGDLSVVKKGMEAVRSVKSTLFLRANVGGVLVADWAPVFWKKYDDFRSGRQP